MLLPGVRSDAEGNKEDPQSISHVRRGREIKLEGRKMLLSQRFNLENVMGVELGLMLQAVVVPICRSLSRVFGLIARRANMEESVKKICL